MDICNPIYKTESIYGELHSLRNYYSKTQGSIKDYNLNFSNLLHSAETLLFEKVLDLSDDVFEIQKFVDDICLRYEYYNPNRLIDLKIAITSTNLLGAVETLILTVVHELEQSKWNYQKEKEVIEFLIIENSTDQEVISDNISFCEEFNHYKIKLNYVSWEEKGYYKIPSTPFDIGSSRILLIDKIRLLNWEASKDHPIWILDDDFEFTTTIPVKDFDIKRTRLGSIFHRLECIANKKDYDAIVGGNSSSPPLPELSTMRLQLMDLKQIIKPEQSELTRKETLNKIKHFPDYYYDLSRDDIAYFPVKVNKLEFEHLINFVSDFLDKLISGIPASRHLFVPLNNSENNKSAWILDKSIAVSGGNTVYFNSELFNSNDYWMIKYRELYSRRADSIWFLLNQHKGYNIGKVNLPLTHARKKRITQVGVDSLLNNSVKDALGVALWEVTNKNMYNKIEDVDYHELLRNINRRLYKIETNLSEINYVLNEISKYCPDVKNLNSYKTLIEVSKTNNYSNFRINKVDDFKLVK